MSNDGNQIEKIHSGLMYVVDQHIYLHIYIYRQIYIYRYIIKRERERERESIKYTHVNCKYDITGHNWIGQMLPASGLFWHSSGTWWHVYRVYIRHWPDVANTRSILIQFWHIMACLQGDMHCYTYKLAGHKNDQLYLKSCEPEYSQPCYT